jgi:hypothetical protein
MIRQILTTITLVSVICTAGASVETTAPMPQVYDPIGAQGYLFLPVGAKYVYDMNHSYTKAGYDTWYTGLFTGWTNENNVPILGKFMTMKYDAARKKPAPGWVYGGYWLNGVPHGSNGYIQYKNGATYTGEVKNGNADGYGVTKHCNYRTFRGLHKLGRPDLGGIHVYPNGRTMEESRDKRFFGNYDIGDGIYVTAECVGEKCRKVAVVRMIDVQPTDTLYESTMTKSDAIAWQFNRDHPINVVITKMNGLFLEETGNRHGCVNQYVVWQAIIDMLPDDRPLLPPQYPITTTLPNYQSQDLVIDMGPNLSSKSFENDLSGQSANGSIDTGRTLHLDSVHLDSEIAARASIFTPKNKSNGLTTVHSNGRDTTAVDFYEGNKKNSERHTTDKNAIDLNTSECYLDTYQSDPATIQISENHAMTIFDTFENWMDQHKGLDNINLDDGIDLGGQQFWQSPQLEASQE